MELTFNLINLECYLPFEKGGDELSIKYKGSKLWPKGDRYHKAKNKIIVINEKIKVKKGEWVELDVYEHDWFFIKQKIGQFKFLVDGKGGPYHTNLRAVNKTLVRYSMFWQIDN